MTNNSKQTSTAPTGLQPYGAEFLGTLLFLMIIMLVISKISQPGWLIALLIGLGLALAIFISVRLKGPGYLNPAVALMLGTKDQKGVSYISGMILAELAAVVLVVLMFCKSPKMFSAGDKSIPTCETVY